MVQQGLSVPPPLRRGGGQRISTGLSIPSSRRVAKIPTSKAPSKPRRVQKKKLPSEETETEEYDESDSDAEYGKPRAKRAKTESKATPHTPTPSTSDSEEEIVSSTRRDVKREASFSSNSDSSDDDNSEKGDDVDEDEVVAAGADFLDLVDDVPGIGQPAPEIAKSLIIKLPAKKPIKSESSNLVRDNLDRLSTVASGLPTYTSTSSIETYPGLDLSALDRNYPQGDQGYNPSEFLSAGYGSGNGLPETSLYGSMISQPQMSYSNGFGDLDDANLEDHDMAEDGWNPTNTDHRYGRFNSSYAFATPPFSNAHGAPTTIGHLPSSLPQLSTSFMLGPAAQEDTVGGEYFSSGSSTINHTPSSNLADDSVNIPWLTRDGLSARKATERDLNDFDNVQSSDVASLHQQYDGYGDGKFSF